ncbi:uncharacterized protein LOC134198184 isoform X2 [Corticium candelabrum]|uniref:uncharacterized protein LOC134198184 isoform X2 n=1 Tax=Corticium candelabrum TaxID=121492 RepID=UPI002E2728BB|nr:uncharacterized protein LOC134198184 isoform X2 [Corticium candelabrum]
MLGRKTRGIGILTLSDVKMQQSFNAKIEELLEKGRERDGRFEDLTSAIQSVNVTVQIQAQHQQDMQSTVSNHDQRLNSTESKLLELQSELVKHNSTLNTLSVQVGDLKSDVATVTQNVGQQNDSILELMVAVNSVNGTVQLQAQEQQTLQLTVSNHAQRLNTTDLSLETANETLSSSINQLQTQVIDINGKVVRLSAPTPLGHVFGSGDANIPEENDGIVTLWQNDRMSDDAPILSGGMEFNGTSFTVPENGTYYIYGLLMIQHDGVSECGWELLINNVGNLMIIDQSINGTKQSIFGSQVRDMNEGDTVLMQSKNCTYNFGVDRSHLGIYQLQRGI